MPLQPGSSRAAIGGNIAELIRSGRPPKQAAVIAYSKAGKSKKAKPSKRPRLKEYVGT